MGSGREGSPSPIGERKLERQRRKSGGGITASMYHMIERDQMLGLHENTNINSIDPDLANALPGVTTTTSLSPHKMASPKSITQVFPVNSFDIRHQQQQEARGHMKRSPGLSKMEDKEEDGSVSRRRRSRSDMVDGRERSPLNSRRFKVNMEEQVIAQEMKKPSVISKLKSPRKFRTEVAEETVLQQPIEVANKRPSSRSGGSTRAIEEVIEYPIDQANGRQSSRSGRSTRRSRIEIVDTEGSDLGMADTGRTTRPRDHNVQAPEAAGNSSSAPRRARRNPGFQTIIQNIDSTEGPDWVQYMVDMIMWQDTPKTAFLFGFGSFCVLSSSYAQDMHFSLITTLSYLALVYLAAVFLYKTIFRRGAIEQNCRPKNYELISEADALRILRFVLPVVNVLLAKFRDLFSGDPATTIKQEIFAVGIFSLVAGTVWAHNDSLDSSKGWFLCHLHNSKALYLLLCPIPRIWWGLCSICLVKHVIWPERTLIGEFLIQLPLCHAGQFMLDRFWDAWNTCSHKKGVLVAVFLMAWNLSSVAARVWGAFILIVALRLYQQSLRTDPENIVPPQEDIQIPEKSATDITGLEVPDCFHLPCYMQLMRIPQGVF
eukprot:Gb_06153 [translate_table: standard]